MHDSQDAQCNADESPITPKSIVTDPGTIEKYIISPLFPSRDIHIITGGSGTNVTNASLQLCNCISTGKDFLGYTPSRQFRTIYLAQGPSRRTFDDLKERMGCQFPLKYKSGRQGFAMPDVYAAIKETGAEVIFLERMERLIEVSDMMGKGITAMLGELYEACENSNITIFGTWTGPKEYTANRLRHVRERISGSGVTAHCAGTVLTMDSVCPDIVEDRQRRMYIQPQADDSVTLEIEVKEDCQLYMRETEKSKSEDKLVREVSLFVPGAVLSFSDIRNLVPSLSYSSVQRRIRDCIAAKILSKTKRDMYVRVRPTPDN